MAESSLHSYLCDESSQDSASDSEDFLEGRLANVYHMSVDLKLISQPDRRERLSLQPAAS